MGKGFQNYSLHRTVFFSPKILTFSFLIVTFYFIYQKIFYFVHGHDTKRLLASIRDYFESIRKTFSTDAIRKYSCILDNIYKLKVYFAESIRRFLFEIFLFLFVMRSFACISGKCFQNDGHF